MKLALEAPTKLLTVAQPLSNIDSISADRLSEDAEYAKLYLNSDNKAKFLAISEPTEELGQLFKEVKATAVIAPAEHYAEVANLIGTERTMVILEGTNPQDILSSLPMYGESPLAIPYNVLATEEDNTYIMSLRRALLIASIPSHFYVHLLGFADLDEFAWYESRPNIGSLATGVPLLLGLQERSIADYVPDKSTPTLEQAESLIEKGKLSDATLSIIYINVALLRKHIS